MLKRDQMTPGVLLVYDGDCALCQRWVERVRWLDRTGSVDTLPLQHARAVPATGRASADLRRAVHLVRSDGTVIDGAGAIRDLLQYLRGGRLVRWLFRLPGGMQVAEWVYGWVARRRTTGSTGVVREGNNDPDSSHRGES
jgi:predicted DCC family thiol-disulfide oxidoreductase YuxK